MRWTRRFGLITPDLFREPDGGKRFLFGTSIGTIFAVTGLFGPGRDFLLFFLGLFLATLSLAELLPTDRVQDAGILRIAAIVCLVMSIIVFLL